MLSFPAALDLGQGSSHVQQREGLGCEAALSRAFSAGLKLNVGLWLDSVLSGHVLHQLATLDLQEVLTGLKITDLHFPSKK